MAISTRLLALPISIKPLGDPARGGEPAGDTFEGSLRQVLRAFAVGALPDQEFVAESLGMSGRGLQEAHR